MPRFKDDSLRLKSWDYANEGWYFLTLVCMDREPLFGEIEAGQIALNAFGRIVEQQWLRSAELRPSIRLGEYVVMPDHFHALVEIRLSRGDRQDCGDRQLSVPTGQSMPHRSPRSISSLVAGFKATCTREINRLRTIDGGRVWQSDYHDRLVRDEAEFQRITEYIKLNPTRWRTDP